MAVSDESTSPPEKIYPLVISQEAFVYNVIAFVFDNRTASSSIIMFHRFSVRRPLDVEVSPRCAPGHAAISSVKRLAR